MEWGVYYKQYVIVVGERQNKIALFVVQSDKKYIRNGGCLSLNDWLVGKQGGRKGDGQKERK